MSARTRRRPTYVLHDGFRMPMGFPVAGFASGLRYRPAASDMFVASYPKCGTTWMQYIVYLLTTGLTTGSTTGLTRGATKGRTGATTRIRPLREGERLDQVFPHLEEVGAESVAGRPQPRTIKTHLPFSMVPYRDETKYVYVARNPFDCAVSFFHHTRGFVHHYDFADGTFEDFFECFIAGEVDFGDYFDHLNGWYAHRHRENIMLVTYERMSAEPERVIAEVGEFLGDAAGEIARDEASVAAIREETRFSSMSRSQRRWSSARAPGMPEFVRKGVVGDWRDCFTSEQARRLADALVTRTRETGAFELWPQVLAEARAF